MANDKKSTSMTVQVGGTHYSEFAIQPTEYIVKNKLDWYEANIVKYTSRHKLKGGAIDIKKVIHYAQMLLEDTYGIVASVDYPQEEKEKVPSLKKKRRRRRTVATPLVGVAEEPVDAPTT